MVEKFERKVDSVYPGSVAAPDSSLLLPVRMGILGWVLFERVEA